jgi:hypothetical protein
MQLTQQQPVRIEARVSAQERRQLNIDARIEELAEDMTASFKAQAAYQVRIEAKVDHLEAEIGTMKADMATKEDIAALEKRMLDAFQQLLTVIDQRLPEPKGE